MGCSYSNGQLIIPIRGQGQSTRQHFDDAASRDSDSPCICSSSDRPHCTHLFWWQRRRCFTGIPDLVDAFPNRAIYALHYPGYGGSSGSPSQQAIFTDSLALFDRVFSEHPNIIVIGRSLGFGVAVWIASQRPIERLILITPFDSLASPASELYRFLPVRWLLRDKFESWRYAPNVKAPTMIIVAEDDEIVRRSSSDRLRTRFRQAVVSYVVVPSVGHNTIQDSPGYWALLNSE